MRILLLHSAYGLRPAVREAEARLQSAGHTVLAPDLYDGATADTLERALALRDGIGREALLSRALAAAEESNPEALMGFSLGASLAQRVAVRRGSPSCLVLFHGVAELAEKAMPGLRIQAHVAEGDPFEPDDELAAWRTSFERHGAEVDLRRYAGGGHLFTDAGLPDFHAGSAAVAWDATLHFLAR